MHILHIGKFYWPFRGGVERVTQQLAEAAIDAGHSVTVLAHASGKNEASTDEVSGVEVSRSPVIGSFFYTPIAPLFPVQLFRVLASRRADVIHAHLPNPSACWLLLCPPAWRVPWVLHWHSDVAFQPAERIGRWIYSLLYKPLEWLLLRRAAAVIATSPNYRDSSRPLVAFRDKCCVIPLYREAVPDHSAAPARWPLDENGMLRVLMVGRSTAYKGHDVLLEALDDLAAARCPVSAVLVGVDAADLQHLPAAKSLQEKGRLLLAGEIDEPALQSLFAACHLLCLPSLNRAEAFGMVLLEAMAYSKPLVASHLPDSGVGWLVEDGNNGWTFPPGDSGALAERLVWCSEHRDALAAAGQRGKQRAESEFSRESATKQLMALYARVQHASL